MNVIIDEKKNEYQLTKEYNRMSKVAQNQLNDTYKRDVELGINIYLAKVQKNMLMLECISMDMAGLSVEQILLLLANMKETYRLNSKITSEDEQEAWLKSKMDEIFGVGKYPYEYIDKLENM